MKNITKIDFSNILENSFIFYTHNFIYNFSLKKKNISKHVFSSFSSKLGRANRRNYIKRALRNIWFNTSKTMNIVVVIRCIKIDKNHFSSLNFPLLLEEHEKMKELLDIIIREHSYMLKLL